MSQIPTYAPSDNFPALLNYDGLQAFTDVYGEQWVAQPGIDSGTWNRAKEVIFSKWARDTPYTVPTAGATVPMDTLIKDTYGLYNPSFQSALGACIIPVAGWYDVVFQSALTTTATGQFGDARIYVNGVLGSTARSPATLAGTISVVTTHRFTANVGDYVQPWSSASVALAIPLVTPSATAAPGYWTYFTLRYRGTGS